VAYGWQEAIFQWYVCSYAPALSVRPAFSTQAAPAVDADLPANLILQDATVIEKFKPKPPELSKQMSTDCTKSSAPCCRFPLADEPAWVSGMPPPPASFNVPVVRLLEKEVSEIDAVGSVTLDRR
jgi:hypothetical protein